MCRDSTYYCGSHASGPGQVVRPKHQHGVDRLVPIGVVESIARDVKIRCTSTQFEHLDFLDEGGTLPGAAGSWAYGSGQMSSFPIFERDMGALEARVGSGAGGEPHVVISSGEPLGEIQVRRGVAVDANDGHVGSLRGLVVDLAGFRATHLLLDEGHLFGKKEVAIPFGSAIAVGDRIQLDLSKQQIHSLPEFIPVVES
jgi:hypothetical protein